MISDSRYGRVAVLMGGDSSEREISLKTGGAVSAALKRNGHSVTELDIGPALGRELIDAAVEAVFICLHGRHGEDGTIQGMLEMLAIPYTGSGVMSSAMAMDKTISKVLFRHAGVPTPDGSTFIGLPGPEELTAVPLPTVIKPSREGSTVGISIVQERVELADAFRAALGYDEEVLAEEYIKGRELTVSVLGEEPRALPIVEVIPAKGFYDYYAKYVTGDTRYICPAEIDGETAERISSDAVKAYRALRCRGLARIDFLLRKGTAYALEVNTVPGMTESSLSPKAAAAAGMTFDELVEEILGSARLDRR